MTETEIVPVQQETTGMAVVFGANTADGVIVKATGIANRLADIVEKKQLYKTIGQKKHVYVDGWTAMLAMLGIFPHPEYCRRLDRGEEIAYEARTVLKHISGIMVGAGEALCSSSEDNWDGRDEYAIKSMAQTRSVGKAARLSFSRIMALAGYAVTPVEDMEGGTKSEPIREPEAKKSTVGANGHSEVIISVKEIKAKTGEKNGKGYTIYGIESDNGTIFKTFDDKFADAARIAKDENKKVSILYTVGKFGNDIKNLKEV